MSRRWCTCGGDADRTVRFFQTLTAELEAHFAQYELVAVDDAADPTVVKALRSWAADLPKPLTILHMSLHQGLEPAMNAGLDAAHRGLCLRVRLHRDAL